MEKKYILSQNYKMYSQIVLPYCVVRDQVYMKIFPLIKKVAPYTLITAVEYKLCPCVIVSWYTARFYMCCRSAICKRNHTSIGIKILRTNTYHIISSTLRFFLKYFNLQTLIACFLQVPPIIPLASSLCDTLASPHGEIQSGGLRWQHLHGMHCDIWVFAPYIL